MRLKKVKGAREYLENSKYYINIETIENNIKLFDNDNEHHIEIGTGKGKFLFDKAIANPNINYIGVEKFDSVLIRAVEKLEANPLPNLKFILCDAVTLQEKFENYFDKLYLNFSDPWPKKRHAKRRLTHKNFLDVYKHILKENHIIEFKTDNINFFEFSVISTNNYGIIINEISTNLHQSIYSDKNIMTEFEKRFSEKGFNINYLQFRFK